MKVISAFRVEMKVTNQRFLPVNTGASQQYCTMCGARWVPEISRDPSVKYDGLTTMLYT